MYPRSTLKELARAKALLRQRIAARRACNAGLAARAMWPLVVIDFARGVWREMPGLARLAMIPAALLVGRTVFPRVRFLLRLLRLAPWLAPILRRRCAEGAAS